MSTRQKSICLVGIGLLFISMALVSCAPVQKTIVTTSNLSTLKGTWEGWTDFGIGQGRPVLTWVEIVNDTAPVQGKITLNNLPGNLASIFPAEAKTAGNNVTVEFTNGILSNHGTLIAQSGKNFLELTYFAGEKPKIQGWFYYWALKGTLEVTKK